MRSSVTRPLPTQTRPCHRQLLMQRTRQRKRSWKRLMRMPQIGRRARSMVTRTRTPLQMHHSASWALHSWQAGRSAARCRRQAFGASSVLSSRRLVQLPLLMRKRADPGGGRAGTIPMKQLAMPMQTERPWRTILQQVALSHGRQRGRGSKNSGRGGARTAPATARCGPRLKLYLVAVTSHLSKFRRHTKGLRLWYFVCSQLMRVGPLTPARALFFFFVRS